MRNSPERVRQRGNKLEKTAEYSRKKEKYLALINQMKVSA